MERVACSADVMCTGADETTWTGMTKFIAAANGGCSSWQQDMEQAVKPPALS